MSEFPSFKFQGVGVLRPPNVSIVYVSGGVLPFFSFFIINNLQKATRLPPETLTIEGAITLPSKNPDFRKSVNDSFCLLRFPDNTALTQQFQFPVWSGLEPFSGWAVDDWTGQNRGIAGESEGAVYPNPIFHRRQKEWGSFARRANPNAPY